MPNEPLANLADLSMSAKAGCTLIDHDDQKAWFPYAEECKYMEKFKYLREDGRG